MDLTSLDSRTAADEGRPLHLKHPVTGEPMMDGENPSVVYVLGAEGKMAQQIAREVIAMPKLTDAAAEDLHERLCASAERLITGFSGLYRAGRPLNMADVTWFLRLQIANPLGSTRGLSFVEQVLNFSGSRAEYLGKPDAASSEPQPKSAGRTQRQKTGTGHAAKT